MKFRSSEDGYITSLRFYKQSNNTGRHVGHLWSTSGQLLAAATFTNETAEGWQTVELPNPVPIVKDTTYVTSYHSGSGYFPLDQGYFAQGVDNPPLKALANGVEGGNGVYHYGASAYPDTTFNASNYWVDAVFAQTVPPDTRGPAVTESTPAANASDVDRGVNVTASFDEPLSAATVTGQNFSLRDSDGNAVPAAVTYNDQTRTATLDPQAPLAYCDQLHGHAEGRRRRGGRRGRQPDDGRQDVVVQHHHAVAERGARRADPRGELAVRPVRPLLRRDPARRGPERVQRRGRPGDRGDAQREAGRDPGRGLGDRRRGRGVDHLGAGRGQPDRDAPRQEARGSARPQRRRRHARQRLHEGRPGERVRRGHRRPDASVPRHRRPLRPQRRERDRDAVLGRGHADLQPGGHPARCRQRRRPGGGVHLRSRPLRRLHAPGQPGLGRPEARQLGELDPRDRSLLRREGRRHPARLGRSRALGRPAGG